MNKQNLWFVSLLSVILILCIYYITIPTNLENVLEPATEVVSEPETSNDDATLVALRVENDEQVLNQINDLENTIVDNTKSTEEKNTAYESLKTIHLLEANEEKIENILKKDFNYTAYVKIDGDQVNITINEKNHNKEIANNIIKRVQQEFSTKKYITLRFQ